jgi:hypothetical protein
MLTLSAAETAQQEKKSRVVKQAVLHGMGAVHCLTSLLSDRMMCGRQLKIARLSMLTQPSRCPRLPWRQQEDAPTAQPALNAKIRYDSANTLQ